MADRKILREMLTNSYNKDELRLLATDIADNDEMVFSDGGTLEKWAGELVAWCGRREKLTILIDLVKEARPEIYKKFEEKLRGKSESQLEAVHSESKEIEEAMKVFQPGETKRKSVSAEKRKSGKSKHPLAGKSNSVHSWFRKLEPDQQAFIVSAALFSGLQRDELMYLYSNTVKVLGISENPDSKQEDHGG